MSYKVVANFVSGLKFILQGNIIIFFHNRYNANIAYTALNTVMPVLFVVYQFGTASIKEVGNSV